MKTIHRLLPYAGLYYAVLFLYIFIRTVMLKDSSLAYAVRNIFELRFNGILQPTILQSLVSPIVAVILLIGIYRYFKKGKDAFNGLMQFGLFYFAVHSLFNLPFYVLWMADALPHPWPKLSLINGAFNLASIAACLLVFIAFNQRFRSLQKPKFPERMRSYGPTPYQNYLSSVTRELGWKRLGNYLLDLFFTWVLVLQPIAFLFALMKVDPGYLFNKLRILFVISIFIYYVAVEALTGRTLGKVCTGTIVQFQQMGSFPGALFRSLCRLIPFEPFSFLGHKGYGWHDSITGTYVELIGAPDRRMKFEDIVPNQTHDKS